MIDKDINVCLISNDEYAIYTAGCIATIKRYKNINTKLNIWVFSNNISHRKKQLLQIQETPQVKINIIDVDPSQYAQYNKCGHIDASTMYKFDIPFILSNIDKILYLDIDVIVKDDLQSLYDTDIQAKFAAVVPYTWQEQVARERMKIISERLNLSRYFNAGVLLLNLKYIREKYKLIDFIDARRNISNEGIGGHDQYIMNYMFKENVVWLDPKYNLINYVYENKFKIKEVNKFYNTNYKSINELIKKSVIIHCTGPFKQWDKRHIFYKLWLNSIDDITKNMFFSIKKQKNSFWEIEDCNFYYILKFGFFKIKINKKNINGIPNYMELIKKGTYFPHPVGIVISSAATIGKNCIIYQNVTIGAKTFQQGDVRIVDNYPCIGDNVTIYAGAVICGPVKIGDNAVIGANSVVINDVPANSIAIGVPAKIIKSSTIKNLGDKR